MWKTFLWKKLQSPSEGQLGGAEKSAKDDARLLAGKGPFNCLPMAAGAGLMEG